MNENIPLGGTKTNQFQRTLLFFGFFFLTYLAGILALVWFNTQVLKVGDPKERSSVLFGFPLWAILYLPTAATALVFIRRSKRAGCPVLRLVVVYLLLIFVALEATI